LRLSFGPSTVNRMRVNVDLLGNRPRWTAKTGNYLRLSFGPSTVNRMRVNVDLLGNRPRWTAKTGN